MKRTKSRKPKRAAAAPPPSISTAAAAKPLDAAAIEVAVHDLIAGRATRDQLASRYAVTAATVDDLTSTRRGAGRRPPAAGQRRLGPGRAAFAAADRKARRPEIRRLSVPSDSDARGRSWSADAYNAPIEPSARLQRLEFRG